MKTIRTVHSVLVLIILLSFGCKNTSNSGLKVLVIAGGHDFDTTAFVSMFNSFDEIIFDTAMQPNANRMIANGAADSYDVLVFYDMWNSISSEQKAAYENLLEDGKGMVFLHHSLVSYQDWEAFSNILGGKYYLPGSGVDSSMYSGYKHDIEIKVSVEDKTHPVTRDMSDFQIHDEGYNNITVNDDVEVLLTADHTDCASVTGWTHRYINSRVVYLMHGHDKQAFNNDSFRKILLNAIAYVANE